MLAWHGTMGYTLIQLIILVNFGIFYLAFLFYTRVSEIELKLNKTCVDNYS